MNHLVKLNKEKSFVMRITDLRKNAEGYEDPTAYEAIKRIDATKRRKRYLKEKVRMLAQFCILLDDDQLKHMCSLDTEEDIDRYVHTIIMKKL